MLLKVLEHIATSSSVYAGIGRGMVFVALAVIVFAIFDRLARSSIGARRRQCPKCRYSFDGLTVCDDRFLCPECGHRSTPTCTGRFERLVWRPRMRLLVVGIVLLVASSFSWWWFSRPAPTLAPQAQQTATPLPPPSYPPPPPVIGSN